jgi:NADH/NAD ratio-sensing transcriptional regulator Rex
MSMNTNRIPDIIIGRLPVYLRALQRLSEKGISPLLPRIGEIIGISAADPRGYFRNLVSLENRALAIRCLF